MASFGGVIHKWLALSYSSNPNLHLCMQVLECWITFDMLALSFCFIIIMFGCWSALLVFNQRKEQQTHYGGKESQIPHCL